MESKKRNKIIIFFVILLAIIAVITIALLYVNNKKIQTSSTQNNNVEVSRNDGQDTETNQKNHLNSDKTKESPSSNEISNTNKNDVIESKKDENKTKENETKENTQSDVTGNKNQQNNESPQNSANGSNTSHATIGGNTEIIQNDDDNPSVDVEIENNGATSQTSENVNHEYTGENQTSGQTPSISNMKVEDSERLDIVNNEYSKMNINFNLLNAPYNNKEYCEEKLKESYVIKLSELPENAKCSDFPTTITINNDGELDEYEHIYTKTGYVDFSNTKFSRLGDYVFDICSETTG